MKNSILSIAGVILVFTSSFAVSDTHLLEVVVSGVRNDQGNMVAVLCKKDEQFPSKCALRKIVKASHGATSIKFEGLARGQYAFAAFHDENGNGLLDMGAGFPTEGTSFGNNAVGRYGAPRFENAAVFVEEDKRIVVRPNYFQVASK